MGGGADKSKPSEFTPTPWSLVRALGRGGDEERRAAEELSRRYWGAVRAYLVRSGVSAGQSDETTQAFFVEVVVGRRLFHKADQGRGRLRTLLLTALDRYRIDVARSEGAAARHRDALAGQSADRSQAPAEVFEREWAAAQLQEAVVRAERHFAAAGKEAHWKAFERLVLWPCTKGSAKPATSDVARELGFDRPEAVGSVLQVVKTRVLAVLKQVVAESIGPDDDLEEEYQHVLRLLSGG